jgi:hypothetical protein
MRKTIAALIGAAATITMISGASLAAASTHPAGARPASVRPAVTKIEHFQAVSVSLTTNTNHIIAYGAFAAGGTDVENSNNTDTFKFPGGTFRVTHKVKGGHEHFSKATCLNLISQHGTIKISHGTGKYAGISGSGTFKLAIVFIDGRNSHGACSMRVKPVAGQLIIQAQGPVTLP